WASLAASGRPTYPRPTTRIFMGTSCQRWRSGFAHFVVCQMTEGLPDGVVDLGVVLAQRGQRLLFVARLERGQEALEVQRELRVEHPNVGEALEQLAVRIQERIGHPAHGDRVARVHQGLEPTLKALGD